MANVLTSCPVCSGKLTVSVLSCGDCGLSLQNKFELNPFNYLTNEQMEFLLTFLKHQGNLKMLQEDLNISYPFAKKKLQVLLEDLKLVEESVEKPTEELDLGNLSFSTNSVLASDIIKKKLSERKGRAMVYSARGNAYEIRVGRDGVGFECDELPIKPNYEFRVFDVMVECLIKNGGSANKGNGRNYKLGEKKCDDTTLVGYVAKHYAGKKDGESVFDPIFVLVAVLEWAEIAFNRRGHAELTEKYLKKVKEKEDG